ncbi:hypothetical protein BpHYR1_040468 [Brachionus plicatilis]|uniref:Uncharacterized protein n=1 Tax=Brachionus plicatilis TaxID=10195 RepID=A0A3M7RE70_BRAPC|nr:hypothetical protein BpHYR1_040468 [Brachionus plicatilis]
MSIYINGSQAFTTKSPSIRLDNEVRWRIFGLRIQSCQKSGYYDGCICLVIKIVGYDLLEVTLSERSAKSLEIYPKSWQIGKADLRRSTDFSWYNTLFVFISNIKKSKLIKNKPKIKFKNRGIKKEDDDIEKTV